MSKIDHTPGPWVVLNNPDHSVGGLAIKSRSDVPFWIAAVNQHAVPGDPNSTANARLIAASPALLDIAEKYIALCTHCGLFQEAEDAKLLVARVRVGE